MDLRSLIIFRTYLLARRILTKRDPIKILRRFAEEDEEGEWRVNDDDSGLRTACGKRMFSSRVKRLWSGLSEGEKVANIQSKTAMEVIKNKIKTLDKNWVLWGDKNGGRGSDYIDQDDPPEVHHSNEED